MTFGPRLFRSDDRRSRDTRAQTALDFVVGVGLFLLVLGFLVEFVPGMLAPYSDDAELPVVAERAATRLTDAHLGNPTTPGELDRPATLAFFDATPDPPLDDLVADGYSINVTAEGNVTGDPTDPEFRAVGDVPPRDGSVAIVRRVVAVEGEDVLLTVRVWR
ncbi:hypothetical protein [Haloferax sp. ATB1]|uniref:DUF7287 family protein n=1 Tax=Haloferax sp. ATB1 TaxID=1508454 RepID=UPI0006932A7C|nr:hypothetical protein [Haloferax sp. ATB1]